MVDNRLQWQEDQWDGIEFAPNNACMLKLVREVCTDLTLDTHCFLAKTSFTYINTCKGSFYTCPRNNNQRNTSMY
jgi:hypothetical protein